MHGELIQRLLIATPCWSSLKIVYTVQGFQNLRNVTGGIDAYSREVDSSVPQY